jgi:hypothetical protein
MCTGVPQQRNTHTQILIERKARAKQALTEDADVVLGRVLLGVVQDEAAGSTCLAHLKLAAAAGTAARGQHKQGQHTCAPVICCATSSKDAYTLASSLADTSGQLEHFASASVGMQPRPSF